jgi:7-cyano-7-deazaguanine synthase
LVDSVAAGYPCGEHAEDSGEVCREEEDVKVMVLLSGGLDSATVLALMRGHERMAIGFDYGQRHRIELDRAAEIAASEIVPFEVVQVPVMPKIDDVVFAGRNAVLISIAASVAVTRGCEAVAIGCNFTDWERFPDCRPAFVKAMGSALEEGYGIKLIAPVLHMSKFQVVEAAKSLNVKIDRTWSCYTPRDGAQCGYCAACKVRDTALGVKVEAWTK